MILETEQHNHDRGYQQGVAIVELLMVLPIFLVLAFSSIEVGQFFRVSQGISLISRELANEVFRECGEALEEDVEACIDQLGATMLTSIGGQYDNLRLRIIVRRTGESTKQSPRPSLIPDGRVNFILDAERYNTILGIKGIVVLVAVESDYTRITPFSEAFWPSRVYEATVI